MKAKTRVEIKLLSFFLTFFIILASLLIFIWMIFISYNSHDEGVPNQNRFMQNKTERFAMITQEDIYIDNMEKAEYTSYGRLKYNKQDNENNQIKVDSIRQQ
jgi:hypothetical protein